MLRGEAWMGRIGRRVFEHFSDQQLDRLVPVCGDEKVAKLVKRHADFDWHSQAFYPSDDTTGPFTAILICYIRR